eukprot:790108_1
MIDNDNRLWIGESCCGHDPMVYHTGDYYRAIEKSYVRTMIYDFNSKQWKCGGEIQNEQCMEEQGNSWYNVYKNGIYCFGSRYTNKYRLYYYNLCNNIWYEYDSNALDVYKDKYHEIQQISMW